MKGSRAPSASESGGGRGSRTPSGGGGGAVPRRSPRLTASAGAKPRLSVQQLKRQQKQAARQQQQQQLEDPLAACDAVGRQRRAATGLVYDERLLQHRCTWDPQHAESPRRLTAVFDRLTALGLVERCCRVPARPATDAELESCHSPEHVQQLRQLCRTADEAALRQAAQQWDSVYLHPTTFDCAALAAGGVLELTDRLLDGSLLNAFAVIRPPGHHADRDQCNGFSYFNNAALAARRAADAGLRVLLVDWDVHHGQGSQRIFLQDNRVLYFSVHRYDGGAFWPHLAESDYSVVGEAAGAGFTWNVPLDVGAGDADLLAVWHQLLLPAAYEMAPDLVIVSAGFDMAAGDPKGEMRVSAACFGHLTHSLLALAGGRLLAVLEGGYNAAATAEASVQTLQVLLGEAPAPLPVHLPPPSQSVEATIRSVAAAHRLQFHCFAHYSSFSALQKLPVSPSERCHWPPPPTQPPPPPPSVAAAGELPTPVDDDVTELLRRLTLESAGAAPKHRVCLATNELMMRHRNLREPDHPERPERLRSVLNRLSSWGLLERCLRLPGERRASAEELLALHWPHHLARLEETARLPQQQLDKQADAYNSVYLCPESDDCARLAAGSLLEAVDSVLSGESQRGVCAVRPPGHHAEPDTAHGFCLYNSVAVAARYAAARHGLRRVLIVDWDVHHGNGTQHMFYEAADVLYMSVHRHDNGFFFPTSDDGDHDRCGAGAGLGYNLNIPWNRARMGGAEYLSALTAVLLPVAYQFSPQLVLISAGFDAARGDPLGGYAVPPEVFGHLTHHLSALAGGRVVLALEGGYNLTAIAYSMAMCVRALLSEPPVKLSPLGRINESAAATLRRVAASQRRHWRAVADLSWRLPEEPLHMLWKLTQSGPAAPDTEQAEGAACGAAQRDTGDVAAPDTEQAEGAACGAAQRGTGDAAAPDTEQAEGAACGAAQRGTGDAAAPDTEQAEGAACGAAQRGTGDAAAPDTEQAEGAACGEVERGTGDAAAPDTEQAEGAACGAAQRGTGDAAAPGTEQAESAACGAAQRGAGDAATDMVERLVGGLSLSDEAAPGEGGDAAAEGGEAAAEGGEAAAEGGGAAAESGEAAAEGGDAAAEGGEAAALPDRAAADDTATEELIQMLLLQDQVEAAMYAVVPRTNCPHLCTVTEVPPVGIDASMPCNDCADCGENWLCLTCYLVFCGRYRRCHMLDHGQQTGHSLVLSLADLSVWCYTCEAYIHHERLIPAKRAAHRSKFGVDMPAGDMAR